ncbi:hypothetical protein OE88DRAFT_181529 [Heliocybe sulcata]|uniref:Uncharacterized protein n=1 Tax=Heliocybe sulcata TaxID=5364 RepID=A0A5C3N028_9AGAM|nr:hypothetical protein OE88DRAFT_181529 [Heliocybe sulcata]
MEGLSSLVSEYACGEPGRLCAFIMTLCEEEKLWEQMEAEKAAQGEEASQLSQDVQEIQKEIDLATAAAQAVMPAYRKSS